MAGKDVDDGIRELKEKRGRQNAWSCSPARGFRTNPACPPPRRGRAVKQYRAVDLATTEAFSRDPRVVWNSITGAGNCLPRWSRTRVTMPLPKWSAVSRGLAHHAEYRTGLHQNAGQRQNARTPRQYLVGALHGLCEKLTEKGVFRFPKCRNARHAGRCSGRTWLVRRDARRRSSMRATRRQQLRPHDRRRHVGHGSARSLDGPPGQTQRGGRCRGKPSNPLPTATSITFSIWENRARSCRGCCDTLAIRHYTMSIRRSEKSRPGKSQDSSPALEMTLALQQIGMIRAPCLRQTLVKKNGQQTGDFSPEKSPRIVPISACLYSGRFPTWSSSAISFIAPAFCPGRRAVPLLFPGRAWLRGFCAARWPHSPVGDVAVLVFGKFSQDCERFGQTNCPGPPGGRP